MFLPSRDSTGRDPLYPAKALALVTGAGVFLAGVRFEMGWLTWVGMGVLGVALLLVMLGGKDAEENEDSGDSEGSAS